MEDDFSFLVTPHENYSRRAKNIRTVLVELWNVEPMYTVSIREEGLRKCSMVDVILCFSCATLVQISQKGEFATCPSA